MSQNIFRFRRIESNLRSFTWLIFGLLFVFTVAVIFTTHFSRLMYITGISKIRPELVQVYSQCASYPTNKRINWNYLYYYRNRNNTRKGLIWCKVPKAGSTTLTKMFLRLGGAKNITQASKIHRMLRDFYPKLANKAMSRRMQSTFKFVVVRDPFERILSAYRDKLESYARDLQFRDGYYYQNYGKYMVKTPADNTSVLEPTWSEFVNYLIKTPAKKYDEHWMPITRLCSPCSVHFDAIIRMERFNEEIKLPLRAAGIGFQIGWAHKTGTSNREIIHNYFRNLTDSQIHRLYKKYEHDFILFGYSAQKYFDMAKPSALPTNGTSVNQISTRSH